MSEDKLDVSFEATKSKHDNCACTCCHGIGSVLKIRMPETLYHDGRKLPTKYSNLWICDNCREKLVAALGGGTP